MKMRGKPIRFVIVGAVCVALLWAGLVMAQEGVWLPITFTKYYTGTIDGKPIEMILERTGSQLRGRLDQGKEINVTGHMDSAGNLFLEESGATGNVTGLFRGKFVTASRIEGKWIKPDGTKAQNYMFEEKTGSIPSRWANWNGNQAATEFLKPEVYLRGSINGSMGIRMKLNIQAGSVTGTYFYTDRKIDVPVKGVVRVGRLLLTEYGEPGKITGRFEGTLGGSGTYVWGFWLSPDESRILPLYVEVQEPPERPENPWDGEWYLPDTPLNCEVTISVEAYDLGLGFRGLDFRGRVTNGTKTAAVDGSAEARGTNLAVWDGSKGAFTFRLKDGTLVVNTRNETYSAGIGVGFQGVYLKQEIPRKQFTFKQKGFFKTEGQEQAFIKTVGPQDYYAFLETFKIGEETADLNKLGAEVYLGYVRGMRSQREGVIMSTPDGRIWAALLSFDTIRYYTNVPGNVVNPPETIKAWLQGFKGKTVQYMSAGI